MDIKTNPQEGQQGEGIQQQEENQQQMIPIERYQQLESRVNQMMEQNQRLMAQQTELLAQIAAQKVQTASNEPDPLEDMDPDEIRRQQALIQRYMDPLAKKLDQLAGIVGQTVTMSRFEQAKKAVADPEVVQRAEHFLKSWSKDPSKGGWTAEDAVIYAAGEKALKQAMSRNPAINERNQFNTLGAPIVSQPGGKGAPGKRVNVDDLPIDEQIAYYEKEIGDLPL